MRFFMIKLHKFLAIISIKYGDCSEKEVCNAMYVHPFSSKP